MKKNLIVMYEADEYVMAFIRLIEPDKYGRRYQLVRLPVESLSEDYTQFDHFQQSALKAELKKSDSAVNRNLAELLFFFEENVPEPQDDTYEKLSRFFQTFEW